MTGRKVLFFVIANLAAVPEALAKGRGYAEIGLGGGLPIADSAWRDISAVGPKLALRGGSFIDAVKGDIQLFAFEVAADWQPHFGRGPQVVGVDFDLHHIRATVGARYLRHLSPDLAVSARLGAGIDILIAHGNGRFAGTSFTDSDTEAGVAIDPAAGVRWNMGSYRLGADLGLPMSIHRDDGVESDFEVDTDYFSLDLNVLFFVSTSL